MQLLDNITPKVIKNTKWLDFLYKRNLINISTYYDTLTDLVFKKVLKHDSKCVDIGCHTGTILQMMMKYSQNGTFYCFEPIPHLYKDLKNKYCHHQNILIYDIALSDIAGESTFNYVITNPAYSGLIKRRYDRPNEEDTKINVKTDLLDRLLLNTCIDLIKIDVEGAELQVLRGAKEVIKRDKPYVIFEHGLGAADYYETTPEDIYDLLNDYCGLCLNPLDQYLKNNKPLLKNEFCEQFYKGLNSYFLAYNS